MTRSEVGTLTNIPQTKTTELLQNAVSYTANGLLILSLQLYSGLHSGRTNIDVLTALTPSFYPITSIHFNIRLPTLTIHALLTSNFDATITCRIFALS